ncbi:hypothetical protein MPSEU_000477800 [Mayamaea pseudoterrestris]|nr:hypothetical protein MPSEU_000477800 [Mayamaea pseudoterrestris]
MSSSLSATAESVARSASGERSLDVASALREARARGLPDGWSVSIDKRNRRKWTAPNGRSCDSIPKALAMSVELGLLPPDTVIISGKNKKRKEISSPTVTATSPSSNSHLPALLQAAAVANAQPPFAPPPEGVGSSSSPTTRITTTLDISRSGVSMAKSDVFTESRDEPVRKPRDRRLVNTKPPARRKPVKSTRAVPTRAHSSAGAASIRKPNVAIALDASEDDDEEGATAVPLEPMNPETALDPSKHVKAPPLTVHYDPYDRDGSKVGWKVRVQLKSAGSAGGAATASSGHSMEDDGRSTWLEGRVMRYDPYYHKHKIEFTTPVNIASNNKRQKQMSSVWIWLRNQEHSIRLATRIVWAHVKGYAWWPAMVIESNDEEDQRPGSVHVEFFGSDEVAWLKDTPETVRSFSPDEVDPVVAKHKKKRNAKAFDLACEEYAKIREIRNQAVVFYAEQAIELARRAGKKPFVAKRIQLHRHDVNYPYGEFLSAKVRTFSPAQKKWLVSFEFSEKSKAKYDACWINLLGKDVSNLHVMNKSHELTVEDLVPFVPFYELASASDFKAEPPDSNELAALLQETCRGCVEYWKTSEIRVGCDECDAEWHLGCFDPPLSLEAWQKLVKDGSSIVCSRCTPCRGCYQKDIVFGCHPQPKPPTLSFPRDETLDLCFSCIRAYSDTEYCSNCAHTYNADKLDKVTTQLEALDRRRKIDGVICDSQIPLALKSFDGDDIFPPGAKVDPSYYYPETPEWGYGEKDMLVCDTCDIWIHGGCAGISEDEYDEISDGKHPVFSKEFLCRACCRQRCKEIIDALMGKDSHSLFTSPVTEQVAPMYFDVIKAPMDLEMMSEKAKNNDYLHYAWVREDFELMVLNALIYNRYYTSTWKEAQRYYTDCLKTVFMSVGKAAPPSKHASAIEEEFRQANEAKKNEEIRIQIDESVEKKDLVAGTDAVTMVLPKLRDSPPDQSSCIPFTEVKLRLSDAFYCSWMDCCYTCGSSGAMDCFIFCCECGETFHSFCVNAPIHNMDIYSFNAWRCPSCKVCEISGQVPAEETSMLFCEMCDRAFTLHLLDPPLKNAPPGLWICGQCVDCKVCSNMSEPGGVRLTHWSCDPGRCFRCGGCDDVECGPASQCIVCSKFYRATDTDIIRCSSCTRRVHSTCGGLFANVGFHCHSCRPINDTFGAHDYNAADHRALSEMALTATESLNGLVGEELAPYELHSKIMDAIAWTSRDMCRDSYKTILREGLRAVAVAKATYGDARILLQHAIGQNQEIPTWVTQRAYRFILVARRSNWSFEGTLEDKIESIVYGAKLATSFLTVARSIMLFNVTEKMPSNKCFASLARAPDECGLFALPLNSVWHGADVKPLIFRPTAHATDMRQQVAGAVVSASPLCGWSKDRTFEAVCAWKDPRACVLCGLPGDDDAGCEVIDESYVGEAKLGRLLPFNGGLFVHSGCALWSSETWEDPHDGLVYGVEKARSRGSQLKCFGCGRQGATVGCSKGNCLYNYHFPCAKACGGAFTSDQHLYCRNHKADTINDLEQAHHEPMKALMIAAGGKGAAAEKAPDDDAADGDLCVRVGALVLHSMGEIQTDCAGFHSEHYITPPGYVATRIFWSTVRPKKRTVYVVKIERSSTDEPLFTILAGDDRSLKIFSNNVADAYETLMAKVRRVNADHFNTREDLTSKLPVLRRSRRKAHGLNGPQFFGFGLDFVRQKLETAPNVEAVIAPLAPFEPLYRFCFVLPSIELVQDLQRRRAAAKAERALENASGCARTEGMQAVKSSGGSGRITRALVRNADDDTESGSLANNGDEAKARIDRNLINARYRRMITIPIEQRLVARRSHIHGWGLFTKTDIAADHPIVEYMGEVIRQPVADRREKAYEVSGEGSCYMFRLDMQRIVDATKTGCLARFMNHSCQPNAYAKIVLVDTETGQEKKILVFANKDISLGEEVTYGRFLNWVF